jgi:hypothetical protein
MLGEDVKDVSLSILDNENNLIKTYKGDALGTDIGLNRMSWDMNYPDAISVPGKPPAGVVVQAKPGTYKAKLTVNGKSQVQSFDLRMNPNETWTQADAEARFDLWWRIRTITENANKVIIAALEKGKAAGKDSELDKQAQAFTGKLLPVGTTLSEMANEPTKLLAKLSTVNWMLIHSEGRPTQSAYDVVDMLDRQINAEVDAWNKIAAKAGKK